MEQYQSITKRHRIETETKIETATVALTDVYTDRQTDSVQIDPPTDGQTETERQRDRETESWGGYAQKLIVFENLKYFEEEEEERRTFKGRQV